MPTFEIEHDGGAYEINAPDAASGVAAFRKMIGRAAPAVAAPSTEAEKQPDQYTTGEAFGRGAMTGATFNWYDELTGLARAGGLDPDDPNVLNAIGALAKGAYKKYQGDPEAQRAYEEQVAASRRQTAQMEKESPWASGAGSVVGSVAVPVGVTARAATLPGRMLTGALTGAGIGALGGAGGAEEDERLQGAGLGASLGAGIGAVAAPITEGVVRGAQAIAQPVASSVRSVVRPEAEAARRVATARERAQAIGDPQTTLTPAELAGDVTGQARVLDTLGVQGRRAADAAASVSPEASTIINRGINDRFEGQTGRFVNWFRNQYPDADAARAATDVAARKTGTLNPAYRKLWEENAGNVGSAELERLAGSKSVASAMRKAADEAGDEAIATGYGAANPRVTFTQDGRVVFNKEGGVPTYPDLQFWDLTKRALGDAEFKAGLGSSEARRIGNLKRQLVSELDKVAPGYGKVRAAGAGFFDEESALEAGRKYVTTEFDNTGARKAIAEMSPQERKLFDTGFVSEYMSRLETFGKDRRNVLNMITDSPAARRKIESVLGPQRAAELEAMKRVEGIYDLSRGAVQGNSRTAERLVNLGLISGSGAIGTAYGAYHGDPGTVAIGVLTAALGGGRHRVNQGLARRMAQMLMSQDDNAINQGINLLARSRSLMENLRATDRRISRAITQENTDED